MAAEDPGFAPAKINLALHVTGRRDDGYHLLDSLVVFAGIGDHVSARAADDWTLAITGPYAAKLSTTENLVLDAARATGGPPAELSLEKHLPLASGIGGGSSDAAATIRVLHAMDGRPMPEKPGALGADIPVCLAPRAARMRGIGDRLDIVPDLPTAHLCLVNPGIEVATPKVFAALTNKDGAPMPDPAWHDLDSLVDWLAGTRNDLEGAARSIEPTIGSVLGKLADTEGCRLARMSGSGATCFGLYADAHEAEGAAETLARAHPDWWIAAAPILS